MVVENICASALLPDELREMVRIKRRAELVSGLKISIRDPKLFKKLEDILRSLGQDLFFKQLNNVVGRASSRVDGDARFCGADTANAEINEECLADGSTVTVTNYKECGVRIKYYDHHKPLGSDSKFL